MDDVKIKGKHVVIAMLVILLLFSVAQAFQIDALEDKIEVTGKVAAQSAPQPTQAPSAPPAMVGGC